jgi:hypothetical protein
MGDRTSEKWALNRSQSPRFLSHRCHILESGKSNCFYFKYFMADEPVSRMQPWCIENTQVIDSAQQKFVSDVSFGSEVRILATTLPQFSLANFISASRTLLSQR